jgi:hypothetical protein
MTVASHRVNICRLRVRGGERDSLSLQNHLAQLLAGADTHPGGLPASAILVVRALRGPLPQMVRRRRETRLPPVWEQMVRATLDDLARRAARPAREAVPADAQAVVFADRAELLACSARDFCEGRIAGLWWWRSLFNGGDLTAVRAAWRETPMYIPAALEVLTKQKKAVSFIRVLPIAETQDWLQALNYTFALRELHAVFSRLTPDSSTQRVDRRQSAAARDHQLAQHLAWNAQHLARPPWQRWVPEATDSELTSEQQCLLGIGLMLQRAPLVARSSSFAASVKLWINAEPIWPANRGDDALVIVPAAPGAVTTVVPQRESTAGARLSPLSSLLPQEELLGGPPQPDSASGILSRATESQIRGSEPEQAATETFVAVPTPNATAPDSAGGSINPAHDEGPAPSTETAYSSELLSPKEADAATRRESREIETAFGGVFYLVNLGLFLGLYGEFTIPSRPGINLALWDFVALVGRELVGGELEDDPVWILLAELAGRDTGEEPGKGFTPPNQALETLSNALISHPLTHEGTGNPLTVSQEQHEKSDSNNVPLRRWLDWLMPRLSARLRRALGLIAHDDLAAVFCRHRAQITVTPTHVDVHLSLADLPITIRLAGLDRDPGWVPAAGRYIAFQFD